MKSKNILLAVLLGSGLWLLSSQPVLCFCNFQAYSALSVLPTPTTTSGSIFEFPAAEKSNPISLRCTQRLASCATRQDKESDLAYYGYRFYNPSTGRWINRDPTLEAGGENVYAFVANNAATHCDPLGLDYVDPPPPGPLTGRLVFVSEGATAVNGGGFIGTQNKPPYFTIDPGFLWNTGLYGYTGEALASGLQFSAAAWFWQYQVEINCPNGLCNSTLDPANRGSSHVMASVRNDSLCKKTVVCRCSVSYTCFTIAVNRRGGGTVNGNVLGQNFLDDYRGRLFHFGVFWFAGASGTKTKTHTKTLYPGEVWLLYRGINSVSGAGPAGWGFFESMQGDCSCHEK